MNINFILSQQSSFYSFSFLQSLSIILSKVVEDRIFIYLRFSIYDQLIYYFLLIVLLEPFISDVFMILSVIIFFSKRQHIASHKSLYFQHI